MKDRRGEGRAREEEEYEREKQETEGNESFPQKEIHFKHENLVS